VVTDGKCSAGTYRVPYGSQTRCHVSSAPLTSGSSGRMSAAWRVREMLGKRPAASARRSATPLAGTCVAGEQSVIYSVAEASRGTAND
jgi:hypothetical protein